MTIYRVRPTTDGVDAYGTPIEGASFVDVIESDGKFPFVAPRLSNDLTDGGRSGVVVGLTLFSPPGTDLTSSDRVLIEDDGANDGTYRIDGQPGEWSFHMGDGSPAGQSTALVRVDG